MTDPLDDAELPELLQADEPSEPGEHLDLPTLAAYLDHALTSEEAARVEEHLANCSPCRALATDSAAALAPPEPVPLRPPSTADSSSPRPIRWRSRALAAAAVLLVCLFAAWFLHRSTASLDPRLEALGVEPRSFARAPESVQVAVLQVLDGSWPAPESFAGLTEDSSSPTLRGGAHTLPRPIAPRWTRTRDRRPTLLWIPARSQDGAGIREEILLVDESERLVATLGPETASSKEDGSLHRATFPKDLSPLEPGRLYAWKINSRAGAEQVASPFVPFRLLPAEDAEPLERDLARLGDDPVLTGLLLARHGLYAEAASHLSSAVVNEAGVEIREDLLRSCLERTIGDPELREQELRRLTGAGSS